MLLNFLQKWRGSTSPRSQTDLQKTPHLKKQCQKDWTPKKNFTRSALRAISNTRTKFNLSPKEARENREKAIEKSNCLLDRKQSWKFSLNTFIFLRCTTVLTNRNTEQFHAWEGSPDAPLIQQLFMSIPCCTNQDTLFGDFNSECGKAPMPQTV